MNLPEPPKPPSDVHKENRDYKKNQNQERQRSERSYRQDRHYKGSYARGSNEQLGRSSDEKPGDKRKYMKIKEPMSPAGMLKAARKVKDECPEVLERHFEEQKLFEWRNGERHLYAENLLKALILTLSFFARIHKVSTMVILSSNELLSIILVG